MRRILGLITCSVLASLALLAPPAHAGVYVLLQNVTTVQTATSNNSIVPAGNNNPNQPPTEQAYQIVLTGSGSVSATVQILGSTDGVNWVNYGSAITLSGTASAGAPIITGATGATPYKYLTGYVSAISGTNASVTATMSA